MSRMGSGAAGTRRVAVSRQRVLLLVICVALLVSAFVSSQASGAQTRPFLRSFGSLSNPQGIAIDQSTGDVYVADTGNNRIEKFDAEGNFLLAFGADVGGVGANTC